MHQSPTSSHSPTYNTLMKYLRSSPSQRSSDSILQLSHDGDGSLQAWITTCLGTRDTCKYAIHHSSHFIHYLNRFDQITEQILPL